MKLPKSKKHVFAAIVCLTAISALAGVWAFALIPLLGVWFYLDHKAQSSQVETINARAKETNENAHRYLLSRLSELRRPLQGILGVRDVYEPEAKTTEMKEFLEVVDHCVKFVVSQIDRVQFFSEFETDRLTAEWRPTDIRELTKRAVRLSEQTVFGGSAKIDLQISDKVSQYLMADAKLVQTALVEVLSNAVKHIKCGPVQISLDTSEKNEAIFRISDCGPGIDEKELAALLTPAHNSNASVSWQETRNGLGLPIMRQVIRKLHGRYSIDTKLGHGTIFTITLPLMPVEPKVHDLVQSHMHAQSSHILVVDDEVLTRQLMRKLLERLGYSVTLAENGKEAIRLQHTHKFGVIFMDIEMPELNGIETADHIMKVSENRSRPQIIALTSHGLSEDRDKCKAAGMSEFLVKPASIKRIEALLQKLGIKPLRAIQKIIELERMYALYGEDEKLVKEIFRQAQGSMPKLQDALNAAVMAGSKKDIKDLLAELKEDFASVHCDEGVNVCEQLGALSAHPDTIEFLGAMDNLNKALHKVMREVNSLIAEKDLSAHLMK